MIDLYNSLYELFRKTQGGQFNSALSSTVDLSQ